MLQVDLTQTTEKISEEVTAQCRHFGNVISVSIHGAPPTITWVEMADRKQALELVARYGATCVLKCALIHLQHGKGEKIAALNGRNIGRPAPLAREPDAGDLHVWST